MAESNARSHPRSGLERPAANKPPLRDRSGSTARGCPSCGSTRLRPAGNRTVRTCKDCGHEVDVAYA